MQIPVCGFERYGWARQLWQRQRQRCKPGVLGRLNHIVLFACLLCQGCVQIPGSIPAPAMPAHPVPAQRFVFRDGGSAQFFTIDKQLSSGPALARSIPGVTHAVIIGNGGMDPIDAYRLLLAIKASAQAARALAALESLPRHASDPDTVTEALGGRTRRYWMELAALHHTETLLALSIPLYVAVGAEDSALPVAAATYLRD